MEKTVRRHRALLSVNWALLLISTLTRVRIAMGTGSSAQPVTGVRKQNCSGANMAECLDLLLMATLKKQVVTQCNRQVRLTPLDSHSNTWISFNRRNGDHVVSGLLC